MRPVLFVITIATLFQACVSHSPAQEIYNKDFKWHIVIPENFENVSAADWAKLQKKGKDAVEKTYDTTIEFNTKTIFVFKSDQLNYFESNYQPFDSVRDGNYLESVKAVNDMLYETFRAQIPGVKIDTLSSQESIDGLVFQKYEVKIMYPNKKTMDFLMYSRLFDKKEFTVNIMYVDKNKADKLLSAWRSSNFDK